MGAFTAFLIWQSSNKNCVYGGLAMCLWKKQLRGELDLRPQISEREESRLKSPHVMRFYPPIFFLLLYISISNVVAKSHRDLSCAKVLWVDKAASSFAVFTWITM